LELKCFLNEIMMAQVMENKPANHKRTLPISFENNKRQCALSFEPSQEHSLEINQVDGTQEKMEHHTKIGVQKTNDLKDDQKAESVKIECDETKSDPNEVELNLPFQVNSLEKSLKETTSVSNVEISASIYLSAVLETISSRVLELASSSSSRIEPQHLHQVIHNNPELCEFVNNVIVANGLSVDANNYTTLLNDYLNKS